MRGLAEVHDLIGRAGSFVGLDFATDTTDPARGARMQRVEERSTAISTKLLFFELEWAELPDEQVEALLADDGSRSPGTICARRAGTGRTC